MVIGLAILLCPLGWLAYIGELFPEVATWSARGVVLRGTGFFDYPEYKTQSWRALRPNVAMLGSSRVMQLRKEVFAGCPESWPRPGDACFYNAGGISLSLATGLDALRALPDDGWPKVLLLGIDIWHVNPHMGNGSGMPGPLNRSQKWERGFTRALTSLRSAYESERLRSSLNPLAPPYLTRQLRPVGTTAWSQGAGFRPDGSYTYGARHDPSRVDRRAALSEGLEQIRNNSGRFIPFPEPQERALADLRAILTAARSHGTVVIGFTPPFMDEFVQQLVADPVHRAWWAPAHAALSREFATAGLPFFAFDSLTSAGCQDDEFVDYLHPAEPCMAKLLLRLISSDEEAARALAGYADRASLERLTSARSSRLFLVR
ncbi:MAG: hypothetical protein ACR2G6_08205 [Gemmatimonadaceae bacterium]